MRFLIPAGVFAALVVFLLVGLRLNPAEVPSPLIGKPAPAFRLQSLHEPGVDIGEEVFLGQVSLFNVWATWCTGCRQEHEALMQIAQSGEVPIYSLNWKDDPKKARGWLQQLGDPYTATVMDPEGRVAIDWGVYGAPETFLIDAQGIVRYKHIGPVDRRVWEQQLLPRIRAARASRPAI